MNEKVKATAEKLSHTAWLAHRQRENLDHLIFAPRGATSNTDCLPTIACLRANLLDQTSFQVLILISTFKTFVARKNETLCL